MVEVPDQNSRKLREGLFQLDPPALLASECVPCGALHYPPLRGCPDCHGTEVRERALSTSATVRTFTIVRNAPIGFPQPYAIAYLDLPEGLQVFAQLTEVEPEDVHIGLPVELVIGPIRRDEDGRDVIAYRYRPRAAA